jgi:hypothetical protein
MYLFRICTLLFFLLPFFQTKAQLIGIVYDRENKHNISGANVSLLNINDSVVEITVHTDSTGIYRLNQEVSLKPYLVKCSMMGYSDTFFTFIPPKGRLLKTIYLQRRAEQLNEVTVTADGPAVVQKGDTTEMSASAYKTGPDAMVEDLVKKMPGITIDNGKLKANGKEINRVLLDGKPFFGDDPNIALKNLPAEVVDKIQIYNKQSEQAEFTGFDDGNSAHTMNIVSRADRRNGKFGKINAGTNFQSKYTAGSNLNLFKNNRRLSANVQANNVNQSNYTSSTSVGSQTSGDSKVYSGGLNFSDNPGKRISYTGSYFFNQRNSDSETDQTSFSLVDSSKYQYSYQNRHSNTQNGNHRFDMKMDVKIDSFNSINFSPRINVQNGNTSSQSFTSKYWQIGDTINTMASDNTNKNLTGSYSGNLLFLHRFRQKGRTASLNINSAFNNNDPTTSRNSLTKYFQSSTLSNDTSSQSSEGKTRGLFGAFKVSYTEPLGKQALIQFSYGLSNNLSKSKKDIFKPSGPTMAVDSSASSKGSSNNISNSGGLSFRYNGINRMNISVGIDFQQSYLSTCYTLPRRYTLSHSYFNLLPNALINVRFSKTSNLNLTYRSSTMNPSLYQLQDVVNNANPLYLTSGNPGLKPQYKQDISGSVSFSKPESRRFVSLNMSLYYTYNYIGSKTIVNNTSSAIFYDNIELNPGVELTRPENIGNSWNANANVSNSFYLSPLKTNLSLITGLGNFHTPGNVNKIFNISNTYSITQGIVASSNISQKIDYNISYTVGYNYTHQSAENASDNKYWNHTGSFRLNLILWKGIVFNNDVITQFNQGLSNSSYNQNRVLWNMSIGKKFLKKQAADLRLTIYDLLRQNSNISRSVSGTNTEDTRTNTTKSYIMLNFTYNIRSFGKRTNSSLPAPTNSTSGQP